MVTVPAPRPAVKPRCPRCAGPLERFDGDGDHELYCPDCTSYTIPPEPPPAAPAAPTTWYTALTSQGEYVESSTSFDVLVKIVREVLDPTDDVVITDGGHRVLAAVLGDTGAVVRVR
jgi:hypothetical protein